MKTVQQYITPRRRGFNLPNLCFSGYSNVKSRDYPNTYQEDDFRLISDWGFNFARLPISYRCLTRQEHPFELTEEGLSKIDQGIEFGLKYNIHINLNIHRAPGFCINDDELEPFGWLDENGVAVDYFSAMWCKLTQRYRGISSERLTFNFINEPDEKPRIGPNLTRPKYSEIMKRLIAEVHAIDPDRHCVFDGWRAATEPMPELTGIANTSQSFHAYYPHELTHYNLWDGARRVPTWPMHAAENNYWDRHTLEIFFQKWVQFSVDNNIGVHVGEFGCHSNTPYQVMLNWMRDQLSLFKEYNLGFALWNLRGEFGIIKSIPNPGMPIDKRCGDFYFDEALLKLMQEN
ncbi:glycoside hydrolase family 5 protein [Victivallis vadensis]|uniref:Endoglucanase n=1 Tax=Victivallis vadensis TaxID=172901 RepID=A0A2U1AFM0_9BACT|nr:cellulase family glycosylhydrolase [Victivallis vadensis]PVY35189.1 endoglucanase [Victivallis vadensis]